MPAQLPLEFDVRPALGRAEFLVSPCNETAVKWIDAWQNWPNGLVVLSGPEGSGKTHLAHVFGALAHAKLTTFAQLSDALISEATNKPIAVVVEQADETGDEAKLFHLINAVRQTGGSLMVTGRTPPSRWPLKLPDLKSRLTAAPQAIIEPPDDGLMQGVMVKLFSDRQIRVTADVVSYALARMPRSFAALQKLVELTDTQALAEKRAITVPLMRDILQQTDWDS